MTIVDATHQSAPQSVQKGFFSLDLAQRGLLWLTLASSWFVIIEPAPYEVLFLLTLVVMLPSGLTFHRAIMPLFLFLMLYNVGGALSMLPVSGEENTKQFVIVSVYMGISALFFATVLSDDTQKRIVVIKNGYIIAAVLGSITGMIGYFDIAGMAEAWAPIQRAQGTFKDPNVLSTFLIAPMIFLVQDFLLGKQKWPITAGLALMILIAGLFFAFSRGAWVSGVLSGVMLVGLMFILTPSRGLRNRIVLLCFVGLIMLLIMFAIAMSFESIRSLLSERANLVNSYDGGERGRFGNQLRSLPLLMESINGIGPHEFAKRFGQDPHNVYLNAFSAYGWLGGFSYLLLTISTIMIGLKTMFTRSPWQWFSIAVGAPLFLTIFQGIQIDTDHWRHFYLLLGMMWGLYAATVRYQNQLPSS